MKILAMGDVHITDHQPKNRTDNYYETVKYKLQWVFDLCIAEKIKVVIQPGDLFDSWKESDFVKQDMLRFFRKWKEHGIHIFTVFGQHDLRYHSSDKLNTPTAILEAAGVVSILSEIPAIVEGNIHLYGSSWGEETVSPEKGKINILAIHSMILESEKLWPGQEDFDKGKHFLKKFPFDYIISGDNHKSFYIEDGDKLLINPGSMLRSNVTQKDHKPCCWILNTKTGEAEQVEIPIKSNVLSFESHEKEKKQNENLAKFIENIKTKTKINGLDFKKNVSVKIVTLKKEVQNISNNIIADALRRLG